MRSIQQEKCFAIGIILLSIVLWSSCRKDFEFSPSTGTLEFSKDTVFLDTVFTNIGSSTYTLKVYNRSKDDIEVPVIRLSEGQESRYRLNVDGVAGKEFTDIPILAKDSIFIFIETTFDVGPTNENEFLYTDDLLFDSGSNEQQIPLVTLVKDAVFLFPSELADGSKETLLLGQDEDGNDVRIEGFVLGDDELEFTNEKPYVIYGYAAVAEGKILNMAAGTRVHFHKDSGILVGQGGSLRVNGNLSTDTLALENEVIFEGDRLEPGFADIPGQWGTVWLSPGSIDNAIEHLTLKNATVGLLVEGNPEAPTPTLTLKNSQIYNSANVNVWARNTSLRAENAVMANAGTNSFLVTLGGSYDLVYSTIANYWTNGFRTGTALRLDNFETLADGQTQAADLLEANFSNCIIDGNVGEELSLNSNETDLFNFSFSHCLIKFRDTNGQFSDNPLYNFENTERYDTIFLNLETNFNDAADQDFRLLIGSEAIGKGDLDTALSVPLDILGNDRTTEPDLGAYEYIIRD